MSSNRNVLESPPSQGRPTNGDDNRAADDFSRQADQTPPGLLAEFWDFLRYNKKWWLLPILFTLLVLGVFVVLSGTALAPFIYALF